MKETKEEFKTELDELKEAIPIDINSLHLNAQEQPELAYRAGKLAAEAKAEARRKQILLDESKAIADREVRLEPSKFGLSKVTEGAVASAVLLHPTVAEANKLKLEVDIFADITQSLREAYQHRKSMLNLEGELYVSNYFGSVEISQNDMKKTASVGRKQTEQRVIEKRREKYEESDDEDV